MRGFRLGGVRVELKQLRFSPENIHRSIVIQTDKIVFTNIHITTISERKRVSRGIGGFGGKKAMGEML